MFSVCIARVARNNANIFPRKQTKRFRVFMQMPCKNRRSHAFAKFRVLSAAFCLLAFVRIGQRFFDKSTQCFSTKIKVASSIFCLFVPRNCIAAATAHIALLNERFELAAAEKFFI